jgi:hypothetical protein
LDVLGSSFRIGWFSFRTWIAFDGYTRIKNGFLEGFGLLVFFGCWIVDESKLPLQEAKEKRVSMKVVG